MYVSHREEIEKTVAGKFGRIFYNTVKIDVKSFYDPLKFDLVSDWMKLGVNQKKLSDIIPKTNQFIHMQDGFLKITELIIFDLEQKTEKQILLLNKDQTRPCKHWIFTLTKM